MYLEDVTSSGYVNKPVDAIYLDFSEALDTISYKRSIEKLKSIQKKNESIVTRIENCLSERKHNEWF